MTTEEIDAALTVARENDIDAVRYEGGYSGRGMFGGTTGAVVIANQRSALRLMLEMAASTGLAREFRVDSLGHDIVMY